MTDLVNLDQALRDIWAQVLKEEPGYYEINAAVLEYGRRVFAMAESKEELNKMLGEPPLRGLKK